MKYLLVKTVEREIMTPEIFDSWERAHEKILDEMAELLEDDIEEIRESYTEDEMFDEDTQVLEYSAWTKSDGENYDWKIFEMDNDGNISEPE